jgi:TonB family protein
MPDPFLETRVADLLGAAERHAAANHADAAQDAWRTALAAVDDALAFDPANQTAARLREQILQSAPAQRPVAAPSFQLLREGDTPVLRSTAVLDVLPPGYLPDPEFLSVLDPTPHPPKPDYLKPIAAIVAALMLAIAIRVGWYYATHHTRLDNASLEQRARYSTPDAPPAAAATRDAASNDDTIYYPTNPGITLPVLRSKFQPHAAQPGRVTLLVVIDPTGVPASAKVWHGLDADRNIAAIKAAEKWRFRPATQNGHPVPILAHLEIEFQR